MDSIKYLSLFTGIGGFEVGIEKAEIGWKCIGYSEIKPHSINIYSNHFPQHNNWGDITKIEPEKLPDFDVIVGGFPCQPYSLASNKRAGLDDQRGQLFYDILRIIDQKKPKVILLENVKGMVSHDRGHTKWLIQQHLRECGYKVFSKVLNSMNFGVPHRRDRLYFVCVRTDIGVKKFEFPSGSKKLGNFRDYLEEDPPKEVVLSPGQILKMKGYGTSNGFCGYLSNSDIYNCITASYRVDAGNSMKFWRGDKISALSPIECERLQGFPDGWTNSVPTHLRYETLGNAVSTYVISEIVSSISDQIPI